MTHHVKTKKLFFMALLLSLVFFLRKGIQYSIIGDPIPLAIVLLCMVLLGIYFRTNRLRFYYISKVWALLVIIWSVVRILIALMNFATDVFDEYHMKTQFGPWGVLLSVTLLLVGVFIVKKSRTMQQTQPKPILEGNLPSN